MRAFSEHATGRGNISPKTGVHIKFGFTLALILTCVKALIFGVRSGLEMAAARVGIQFIPGVVLSGLIILVLGGSMIRNRIKLNDVYDHHHNQCIFDPNDRYHDYLQIHQTLNFLTQKPTLTESLP